MKKNLFVLKFIAAFTSIVLLFASVPGQVFAIDLVVGQEQENTVENDGEGEVFIVGEDQSKRGQFEKHYLCSDGTYMSVTYPEAVHYLDADGVWQDVDQTLCFDAQTGVYTGGTADFRVSFASGASATDMARMEHNGYTLTWGVQAEKGSRDEEVSVASAGMAQMLTPSASAHAQLAERAAITYASPSERLAERDDSYVLPHISAQIGYTDVFDGTENVSLRYTVYHNKIEEDIVIHERGDMESVSMHMDVGTLTPRVNADGSVDFTDADGEMQFRVGIPYMSDAANNVCNDIRVSAEKTGDTCLITYTPDAAWFTSSDRVYPVLLDPSVSTNDYVTNIEDTYVAEGSSANHSSEQYLSIANAAGSQKLIVLRINKLPAVDDALPIIDAKLTLTAQYAPFGEIPMSAYYADGVVDFDDYNFGWADFIRTNYTFVTHSYLFENATHVSFSLTSNIYTMYEAERWCKSDGSDYCGDFVIGYTSSETTWACNPFYSMEFTTVANRPVLTVKYGYALPAGILNGGIYSFQNYESYSYMTVNGAEPANNSNVFQVSNDDHIAATTQKFKLEYVASSGSYRLRSMSSSSGNGKVLDIQRAGGEIYSGRNVQIYSATDPMSQEWLIIPVNYSTFRIVPRANMSLALATNGTRDGNNTGKTASSPGNIFVQTVDSSNQYQLWNIFDNQDEWVETGRFRSDIDTGIYYMISSHTGRYLHRTGSRIDCSRGMLSELGENKLQWRVINLGDGDCLIQRVDSLSHYLVPNAIGSGVTFQRFTSEDLPPDQMRWSIKSSEIDDGGGCVIRNKANGQYLTASEDATSSVSLSEKREKFNLQIWNVIGVDAYNELNVGVKFDDLAIDVDGSMCASVKKQPGNAHCAGCSNFEYTILSGSDCVSYSTLTHKFTGKKEGSAQVKAVHKTTGIERTFSITVNCRSVVIPCMFGRVSSLDEIKNFPVRIAPYIAKYDSYLRGVEWVAYGNGAMEFNPSDMTVTGIEEGIGWIEARKNGRCIFICYVVTQDIFSQYPDRVQQYLSLDGTAIGTMSCKTYEQNPDVDPLLLRTEWYLCAISMSKAGKSDDEIRAALNEKFELRMTDDLFRIFISEIEFGDRGGYTRENLKLSFDGLRSLLNFFWFQYAAYSIATLDTVNVYTPVTAQEAIEEQEYARRLSGNYRGKTEEILDSFTQNGESSSVVIGTSYNQKKWNEVGEALGASYFYNEDYDKYNASNPFEVRAANHQFIQNALEQNKTIYCSHDPGWYYELDKDKIKFNSTYARELREIRNYCLHNNYSMTYGSSEYINNQEVWRIIITKTK